MYMYMYLSTVDRHGLQCVEEGVYFSTCAHISKLFLSQVMESGLLSPNLLAEVFIPIPDPQNTVSCGMDFENYQFSNSKVVSCSHAGVGSGESHSWSNEILITSGAVKVGVAWAEDDKGRALCPPDFRQTSAFRSVPALYTCTLHPGCHSNILGYLVWA